MRRPARRRRVGTTLCALPALLVPLCARAVTVTGPATIRTNVTDGIEASGASGDLLTIASGVSVLGTAGGDLFGPVVRVDTAGYDVTNQGDVGPDGFFGVQFAQGGSTLVNSGSIDGISAVSFLADGTFENSGSVTGNVGVEFAGQGTVTNTGSIDTTGRAITLLAGGSVVNDTGGVVGSQAGRALQALATSNAISVTNRGSLTSQAAALPALELRSSSGNTLVNAGSVVSVSDAVVIGGPATASNSASISSSGGRGVVLESSGTFTNDGSVSASGVGVQVNAGATVTNRSAITSSAAEGVRLDGAGTLANQGSISGATRAVLVTAGGSVSNSGSLSGGTGAAIAFTGTADNTFTHSGSATTGGAGVAIDMGAGDDLVVLQSGASLSAGIDGGPGNDTLRLEGSGSLDQPLQNVESLVVNASAWSLLGNVGVGNSQITAGSLNVAGSLAGSLNVAPAGSLTGGGSVGDVVSSGVVSPGNGGIGTLSAASYVQQPGGTLAIEVSGAGADRLAVSGPVDLQGGTLDVTPVGSFSMGGPYDILTAGDLGAGQFASISASPLLSTDVQYTPGPGGRVSLSVELAESFASVAATRNQAAVATAVDDVFPTATGDLSTVLGGLLAVKDVAALQDAYDQLSPEPLSATAQVTFIEARWHSALLTDHLRDLRLGIARTDTLGTRGGGAPAAALAASGLSERREPGVIALRANAWGAYSTLQGDTGHTGYDALGGLFGIGADTWLDERVVLGADLSAGYTRIDSERPGSDINGFSGRLTGFGSLDLGRGYVDGLASYAYHWFDARRRVQYDGIDRDAKSDHGANELDAYLGTGLEFSRAGFDFGPEASGQYSILFEEGYREDSAGAAGLRIDARQPDALSTRVGIRVSRPWQAAPDTLVTPHLRLGWGHEWLDTSYPLRAAFASPGAPEFEVTSRQLSRNSLVARIGARALLGDDIVVEGDYGLDLGGNESMSHQIGIVLRAAF